VGGEPGVEDERGEEECGAEGGDFDCAAGGHGNGSDEARGKEARKQGVDRARSSLLLDRVVRGLGDVCRTYGAKDRDRVRRCAGEGGIFKSRLLPAELCCWTVAARAALRAAPTVGER
jgi:hypothetical protein